MRASIRPHFRPEQRKARHLMSCAEKERLVQDYEATTTKFAEAVREIQMRIGTSTRSEYERLQRASDEARVRSEQARLALEQHVAAHKC